MKNKGQSQIEISKIAINYPEMKPQIKLISALPVLASLLLLAGCASLSPLEVATEQRDIQTVKALLDAGANVNDVSQRGFSPLMYAADNGDVGMVKLLIAKGADVNKQVIYCTALSTAAAHGHTEIMDLLIDNGADVDRTVVVLEECVRMQTNMGLTDASAQTKRIIDQLRQIANRKGWTSYTKGEFEKGITAFKLAIQQNPADAGAFGGLAACHDALGQYDEAVTAAKQAISLNPKAASGHVQLGKAYWHRKQNAEAEKELKLAIELEPRNPDAYVLRLYYFEAGQYQEALQVWNRLAGIVPEQSPARVEVLRGLMMCNYLLGKYDDAIANANMLVEVSTINGLGIKISKQQNNPPQIDGVISTPPANVQGLVIGDKIIKINGNSTTAMDWPTVVQTLRGAIGTEVQLTIVREGSVQPINISLRRRTIVQPEAAFGFAGKSLSYREKADSKQADENARKAMELNPADEGSQLAAGVVALDKEQFADAITILSPYPTNNIVLATAYAKLSQFDAAAKLYLDNCDDARLQKAVPRLKARQAFLAAMRPYTQKLIESAKQLEASQQPEAALAELAKAVTVAEDDQVEAVRTKLFLLAQRTQPKESEEAYRYAKRGDLMVGEGNLDGAIGEYNKALRLAPYSPRLYFNAALIHGTLKNYTKAMQYMKTYAQLAPNAPNIQAAKDALIEWDLKLEKK